ncbi:phage baseplate assembly protein V [Salinicola rhizosphaerae]|uniref:Baseplate assembly protein n=1 Tax=Salinicola rhizosphaerae TaxID=1443141 RepID=A0ABQ3EBP9_9GAMM|nr:phage baseplate assembly protein V [Salinicola rhizosphaerae]GHB32890.1 baseplate assembly protein [Salinicola rhizosphaerae]
MNNAAELLRLINNLIRYGTIAEIDHDAVRVRVRSGDALTDWIRWQEQRAGQTRTWNPPSLGEQVVLLAPGGELRAASVLMSLNTRATPPPSADPNVTMIELPDGAIIHYDHGAHHLQATLPGTATVKTKGDIVVNTDAALTATAAGGATINANVIINGDVTLNGNLSQPSGKTATMAGDVKFTGGVTSNGKDISSSHTHDDVKSGGDKTGGVT